MKKNNPILMVNQDGYPIGLLNFEADPEARRKEDSCQYDMTEGWEMPESARNQLGRFYFMLLDSGSAQRFAERVFRPLPFRRTQ